MPRGKKKIDDYNLTFQMIVGFSAIFFLAGLSIFVINPTINKKSATASFSFPAGVSDGDVKPLPGGLSSPIDNPADKLPQCEFKSHNQSVVFSQPVRLYWDCIKADRCSLTDIGNVPTSQKGGIEFIPRKTAIYTLECSNEFGGRSFDIPIRVFEFVLEKAAEGEGEWIN